MTPWPHPFREAPSHPALRCRDSCADRLKTASCPFAISAADGDDRQKSPSEQPRLLHEREVPAGVSLEDSGLASEPPRTREENENPNDEVPPIVSRKKSPGSSPLVAADVGGPRVGGPQPVRSKKLTEPNLYACTAQTHNHHCASPTLFQERERFENNDDNIQLPRRQTTMSCTNKQTRSFWLDQNQQRNRVRCLLSLPGWVPAIAGSNPSFYLPTIH